MRKTYENERSLARAGLAAGLLAASLAACAGKVPETRYYQLAAAAPAPAPGARGSDLVLALEPLAVDDAYQDERIVYRSSPYRLDYYNYHRWSAPPGTLIADYLEQALERSGKFRAVVREADDSAPAVLGGRVLAIEEVDESPTRWLGRITVELTLKDAQTGAVLWTDQIAETEPLPAQSPEGLARALSAALDRIARRVIPAIAEHTQQAAAGAPAPSRVRSGQSQTRAAARASGAPQPRASER
jgi:cholesterol transport system auxiliary component